MGTNETGEEGDGGTNARPSTNTNPNNQSVTTRVRPKKDKGKQDTKKFRGETTNMNGHVFKLHAERNTTIEGELKGGKLVSLLVTPTERRKDVVVLPLKADD